MNRELKLAGHYVKRYWLWYVLGIASLTAVDFLTVEVPKITRDIMDGLSADPVNGAQPWILPQEKPAHTLSVLCRFRSEADLPALTLALEDAECSELLLDGRPVPVRPDGCFVDSALSRVPLGPVSAGEHTLEIRASPSTAGK